MGEFEISLDGARTRVLVQPGALSRIGHHLVEVLGGLAAYPRVAVVSDARVGPLYGPLVLESLDSSGFQPELLNVPSGEASKSKGTLFEVYGWLASRGFDRESVILALGGGVVSDLAGFAAATWMRGVRFAICPTTLEADVDACLGGKTAINLTAGKNLVGAFHQPCLVLVDPECLSTLEERDVRAGLAESVKHALIHSEPFLAWHESSADDIVALERDALAHLIFTNLKTKSHFVSGDPEERGLSRIMLNFGHTLGHALEADSQFDLRHGECVSLGMVGALRLSERYGLVDGACVSRVVDLLDRLGLPTRLDRPVGWDPLLERMRIDKKSRNGRLRLVLLEGVGKPVVRDDVPEDDLRAIVETCM